MTLLKQMKRSFSSNYEKGVFHIFSIYFGNVLEMYLKI
jgi:hypothetical protein